MKTLVNEALLKKSLLIETLRKEALLKETLLKCKKSLQQTRSRSCYVRKSSAAREVAMRSAQFHFYLVFIIVIIIIIVSNIALQDNNGVRVIHVFDIMSQSTWGMS